MSPVVVVRSVERKSKSISPKATAELKHEIERIGSNGTRQGFKFAEKMFSQYPELRRK